MKKRSPPSILVDEHFEEVCNPPSADYRTLDGVLKPLLIKLSKTFLLVNHKFTTGWPGNGRYPSFAFRKKSVYN
jgi:hypothetical protein